MDGCRNSVSIHAATSTPSAMSALTIMPLESKARRDIVRLRIISGTTPCGRSADATPSRTGAPIMAESNLPLAGTSAGDAEAWDEAWGTDSFADLELKGVWERTGKGKKRWAPGDTTGDAAVAERTATCEASGAWKPAASAAARRAACAAPRAWALRRRRRAAW